MIVRLPQSIAYAHTLAKKAPSRSVLTALIGLLMTCFSAPSLAQSSEYSDSSVRMFGQTYSNMREYVASEAFRQNGGRCGLESASSRVAAFRSSGLVQQQANPVGDCTFSLTRIQDKYDLSRGLVIKVWFHVIQGTNGQGAISDARINAQMDALNEDFLAISGSQAAGSVNTRLQFELAGITRSVNNNWYNDKGAFELQYKQALGVDQNRFMNVYTNAAGGFLGFAYLPNGGTAGSTIDGITMLSESIGGRNNGFGFFDQGKTLTHEVGHYLGLFHTFSEINQCANGFSSGDLIVDTPAESEPYFNEEDSCPASVSCGSFRAEDNFMNYNRDSCMERFTPQQSNRMVCTLLTYRPQLGNAVNAAGALAPVYNLLLDEDESAPE